MDFAKHKELQIWDKNIVKSLENQIKITYKNKIIDNILITENYEETQLIDSGYEIIITNNYLYHIEHFIVGNKINKYTKAQEILSFFNDRFCDYEYIFCSVNDNIREWVGTWNIIYRHIKDNFQLIAKENIFLTEFFNSSVNESIQARLLKNGILGFTLISKNSTGNSTLEIYFKLEEDKLKTKEEAELYLNLSVRYRDGDSDYGYRFYYSKNKSTKYSYPNTPQQFKNMFDSWNLNQNNQIYSLNYF
jgi:hypothetical protein